MEAAKLLDSADTISIFGNGPSNLVALSLHYNLKRIGLDSICESVIGFQAPQYRQHKKKQVAVVVSSFAAGEVVRSWIAQLKNLNYKILLITTNPDSPFVSTVDVALTVRLSENSVWKIGAFASKTIMNYIIDVLFAVLFNINYLDNIKILYDTASRLDNEDTIDLDFIRILSNYKK